MNMNSLALDYHENTKFFLVHSLLILECSIKFIPVLKQSRLGKTA